MSQDATYTDDTQGKNKIVLVSHILYVYVWFLVENSFIKKMYR